MIYVVFRSMKWYLIILILTLEIFTNPSHTNLIFISVFPSLREAGALLVPLPVARLDLDFATLIYPTRSSILDAVLLHDLFTGYPIPLVCVCFRWAVIS